MPAANLLLRILKPAAPKPIRPDCKPPIGFPRSRVTSRLQKAEITTDRGSRRTQRHLTDRRNRTGFGRRRSVYYGTKCPTTALNRLRKRTAVLDWLHFGGLNHCQRTRRCGFASPRNGRSEICYRSVPKGVGGTQQRRGDAKMMRRSQKHLEPIRRSTGRCGIEQSVSQIAIPTNARPPTPVRDRRGRATRGTTRRSRPDLWAEPGGFD